MTECHYFDNAATTAMSPKAIQTYGEVASTCIGNPSSRHPLGLEAKELLEQCRLDISSLLGVNASSLVFTSGATEANALVMNNLLWSFQAGHVVMNQIEHPSVKGYERILRQTGWEITSLNAPGGFVQGEALQNALTAKTRLVCIMLVNNVVGSIQDVQALVGIVRAYEKEQGRRHIHVHCDATQALGKIPFSLTDLGVDSASFSAHKFCGPRGVGFLYNKSTSLQALSRGGEQENGYRPGTENVAGIAAMTTALKEAVAGLQSNFDKVQAFNQYLRDELSFLAMLSPMKQSSPYILNLSVKPLPSEVFTRMLADKNYCVSSGSACSNNAKQKQDTILSAMHISASDARSSIRLSFSATSTEEEVLGLASTIQQLYREHT